MRARSCSALRWSSVLACALSTTAFSPVLAAQDGQGSIVGRVVDSLGGPLSGAQVSVQGTNVRAITDASGAFALFGSPRAMLLSSSGDSGYRPESPAVRVNPRGETRREIRLCRSGDAAPHG